MSATILSRVALPLSGRRFIYKVVVLCVAYSLLYGCSPAPDAPEGPPQQMKAASRGHKPSDPSNR